jgi:hypothetical protein
MDNELHGQMVAILLPCLFEDEFEEKDRERFNSAHHLWMNGKTDEALEEWRQLESSLCEAGLASRLNRRIYWLDCALANKTITEVSGKAQVLQPWNESEQKF